MQPVREFLRLPAAQRCLLIRAAVLVGAIRLGLWLLPFRVVRGTVRRLAPPVQGPVAGDWRAAARIAWAVRLVSRYVPAATCLTQALAVQVLLRQWGYPACLRIGVAREADGKLAAHAWVESQGRIVIGGTDASIAQYTALPPLEGEQA